MGMRRLRICWRHGGRRLLDRIVLEREHEAAKPDAGFAAAAVFLDLVPVGVRLERQLALGVCKVFLVDGA